MDYKKCVLNHSGVEKLDPDLTKRMRSMESGGVDCKVAGKVIGEIVELRDEIRSLKTRSMLSGTKTKWNPDYTHFVEVDAADVHKLRGGMGDTAPLYGGWEYAEDARDAAKELKEDGIKAKVISRKTAKSRGLLGLHRRKSKRSR